MKNLLLSLTVVLLSAFALAQKVPEGPSPLVIVTEGQTNQLQTGIAAPGTENVVRDTTPMIVSGFAAATNAALPGSAESAATTELASAARVSFLVDTGVQYAKEGEYKEAEQAYLRALQADPGNPDLLFRLSTLYIQMERFADAIELLNTLIEAFPENPMLYNNLAWIYATGGKMKNGPMALRLAREALLMSPYTPSLWNTLAEAYYVSGQYDQALRSSEFAIELIKFQKDSPKEDLIAFQAQHAKIKKAADSYKMLLGLDQDK
jgi:predicted Zn-dependent protease